MEILIVCFLSFAGAKFVLIKPEEKLKFERFPYVLGLQREDLLCPAVLISGFYSMSTRNCVEKGSPKEYILIGGVSEIQVNDLNYQVRTPEMFYPHPNFTESRTLPKIYTNNLAAIKVKLEFTFPVKPVTSYMPNDVDETVARINFQKSWEYLCLVIGWRKNYVSELNQVLISYPITLISNTNCLRYFSKNISIDKRDDLICGLGKKEDSCLVDSSILVCDNDFIGFLSWKQRCGLSRRLYPNVFNAFWPSWDFFKNYSSKSAEGPFNNAFWVIFLRFFLQ